MRLGTETDAAPRPDDSFALSGEKSRVLVLACGALAKEILWLFEQLKAECCDIQCIPAQLHNRPQLIPERLRVLLSEKAADYERVLVAYADCGTGGGIDRVLANFPNAERLEGAHCYATYSGQEAFAGMMEQELGSFFLTDYMVRHFDRLIIEGMGLDRHPELRDAYFAHYRRVVYLAQIEDAELKMKAEQAAERLGLSFEYRYTGMGELAEFIARAGSVTRE